MVLAHVDSRQVERYLSQIASRSRKLPLRKMAIVGQSSVLRNFQVQGRPEKWKALKESTVARRRKGSGQGSAKILMDTGHMRGSISVQLLGASNFKVFTDVPYAPYPHYGTKTMPARPYMMWQDEDISKLIWILQEHLIRGH